MNDVLLINRKTARITGFKPHSHRSDWQVASFDSGLGMTIEPFGRFYRVIGPDERLFYAVHSQGDNERVISIGFRDRHTAEECAERLSQKLSQPIRVRELTIDDADKMEISFPEWGKLEGLK